MLNVPHVLNVQYVQDVLNEQYVLHVHYQHGPKRPKPISLMELETVTGGETMAKQWRNNGQTAAEQGRNNCETTDPDVAAGPNVCETAAKQAQFRLRYIGVACAE